MATKIDDITLNKQSNTLTLNAAGKYVEEDKFFNIDIVTGAGSVTVASTDASVQSDESTRNICGVFGTKGSSAPSTGYYVKIEASGVGSSSIVTAGWLNEGSIGTASASATLYYPVAAGAASIVGTNTLTPSASLSGSNVTFSNTNNGVSVTATGGGSASAEISATGSTAGYIPLNTTIGSGTVNSTSETTTSSLYISGVTLTAPATGEKTFSVTVPNGASPVTFVFYVDASGNVTISDT